MADNFRLRRVEPPLTRSRLEQEYVFMGMISTFLRAIRAGAVHVRHGAVLLAHYGRLGPAFDLCTKVIIDSLREEGMYRENGDIVVEVVTQALKEVRFRRVVYRRIAHSINAVVHTCARLCCSRGRACGCSS